MGWLKSLLPSLIPSPVYGWALLIVFALGAAAAGSAAWTVRGWQADARVNAIERAGAEEKRRQAEAITQSTQEARQAEARARDLANSIEVKHHEYTKSTERILADNRRLARQLGGLRDPGRRESCNGAVPSTGKTPGGNSGPTAEGRLSSEAEGLLSAEASEFLLEFAAAADRAAVYAQTCHEWAVKMGQ